LTYTFEKAGPERARNLIWVSVVALLVPLMTMAASQFFFGDQLTHLFDTALMQAQRTHLTLPVTILVFIAAAYVGVPQMVLISACVIAFGPQQGFWHSWIATIASGAVTYATGRFASESGAFRMEGAVGERCTRLIANNAFAGSFLVRFCIGLPFLIVNSAFGAARANFLGFTAGLALGALPKTALIVFAGHGIVRAVEGQLGSALLLCAAAVAIWFACSAVCARVAKRA
jgi:uncharacterized membrane protein YdjX (TVP38/TMEM64 family)